MLFWVLGKILKPLNCKSDIKISYESNINCLSLGQDFTYSALSIRGGEHFMGTLCFVLRVAIDRPMHYNKIQQKAFKGFNNCSSVYVPNICFFY
jgi:hypothetical protein